MINNEIPPRQLVHYSTNPRPSLIHGRIAMEADIIDGDDTGLDSPSTTSIFDLLISNAAPSNHISSSQASEYLDTLVSLPLDDLLREPSLILEDVSAVDSELVNLCFREYPTFCSVHKASSAVQSAFDEFSASLGSLIDAVPELEKGCATFNQSASLWARGRAALVLEHGEKLQDLLEIPQLMDTCVRNGYYQEAMELATHAEDLAAKLPSIEIVQDITKEVAVVQQHMLAQLLALLRHPVKLPTLVKAVSFLRRLSGEADLSLIFIMSRLQNFKSHLVSIERDRSEAVRYLRRYIDLFREHVYDIISHATAIFHATAHLAAFASLCVADLVELVEAYVPEIANDAAAMSSILVQLGYCAMSFSRVGLDFSALVGAPFCRTVQFMFDSAVRSAASELGGTLRNAANQATPLAAALVTADHALSVLAEQMSPPPIPVSDPYSPPSLISHFRPLALYLNACISALNALRLLAPTQIYPRLLDSLSTSLASSTAAILEYADQAVNLPDAAMSRSTSTSKHTRTPSSPRAHLLRRNTETMLSPEVRAVRRRETRRLCVAFADAWLRVVVPFLLDGLRDGIFGELPIVLLPEECDANLKDLRTWIEAHSESEPRTTIVNGHGSTPESSTKARFSERPASMTTHREEAASPVQYSFDFSPTITPESIPPLFLPALPTDTLEPITDLPSSPPRMATLSSPRALNGTSSPPRSSQESPVPLVSPFPDAVVNGDSEEVPSVMTLKEPELEPMFAPAADQSVLRFMEEVSEAPSAASEPALARDVQTATVASHSVERAASSSSSLDTLQETGAFRENSEDAADATPSVNEEGEEHQAEVKKSTGERKRKKKKGKS